MWTPATKSFLIPDPLSKKTLFTILKYVLGLGLGIALLFYALSGVNFDQVRDGFAQANYIWVALGLMLALTSHWVRASRLRMLYKAAGYESNTLNLFAAIMIGYLVNQAIPRAGEITRVTMSSRTEKIPLSVSFGTLVTDRLFDVIILGLLALGVVVTQLDKINVIMEKALAASSDAPGADDQGGLPVKWIILGVVAVGLVVFLIFRKKIFGTKIGIRLQSFLLEMWKAVKSVRKMHNPLLFVFYTAVIWTCYILMTSIVFYALDGSSNLPFWFAVTVFTMGGIGMVLPSPGGIGTYHFAVIMTFVAYAAEFGMTEETARTLGTNIAFIIHTSQLIMMIVVGFLCYLYLIPKLKVVPMAADKDTEASVEQ
jgi:uncharacterized membrane protein YbhN (UPF0104 family)